MTQIVYLHGFASSPASGKAIFFKNLLERLGVSVQIPDLAAGDFEHLTISGQLAIIDRAVNATPVILIGSSMGGYLAALYAEAHPEVQKLVLLAPAFGFGRRWPERLGPAAMEEWRRTGFLEVFHYGDNCNRRLAYDLADDVSRYADNPDFRQPALIFHGLADDVVPVAYSEQFAASHPNARLEKLAAGHDLHNVLDYMGAETVRFLELTG